MAVRVRTARLRSRLRRMQQELPRAVIHGTFDAAEGMKNFIQVQVSQDWQGAETKQVGFSLSNFINLIDRVETTGDGHGFGILNVQKMGTADDFEKIAQSPQRGGIPRDELLWHTGRRMGDSFRRLIVERPANRQMLAEARKAVWGDKEPQWWLLNYGNLGTGGDPQHAGTFSIEEVAYTSEGSVREIVERSVNEYLRQSGVLI